MFEIIFNQQLFTHRLFKYKLIVGTDCPFKTVTPPWLKTAGGLHTVLRLKYFKNIFNLKYLYNRRFLFNLLTVYTVVPIGSYFWNKKHLSHKFLSNKYSQSKIISDVGL